MIAYAITDPTTLNFNHLTQDLERFSQKASMVVYRDKSSKAYEKYASVFLKEAKRFSFDKRLLHSDYLLAKSLHADGVHLRSAQLGDIAKAKALGLFVIISTHSLEEVIQAKQEGADMVTFSPIFSTPNKGKPVGVETLKKIVTHSDMDVIALGGILTSSQIEEVMEAGAKGFASIRYFA